VKTFRVACGLLLFAGAAEGQQYVISTIVNLERVARIEPYGKESRLAILDGTRLPVSRPGYARLLEAMGDSQGRRSDTR
jgi:hypothetical protein